MKVGEPWKAQKDMFNRFEIAGQLTADGASRVGLSCSHFHPLSAALLFYWRPHEAFFR